MKKGCIKAMLWSTPKSHPTMWRSKNIFLTYFCLYLLICWDVIIIKLDISDHHKMYQLLTYIMTQNFIAWRSNDIFLTLFFVYIPNFCLIFSINKASSILNNYFNKWRFAFLLQHLQKILNLADKTKLRSDLQFSAPIKRI